MEGLRARFRKDIADLPKARYESKRQRLRIGYSSSLEVGWAQRIKSRPTEDALSELFRDPTRVGGELNVLCLRFA